MASEANLDLRLTKYSRCENIANFQENLRKMKKNQTTDSDRPRLLASPQVINSMILLSSYQYACEQRTAEESNCIFQCVIASSFETFLYFFFSSDAVSFFT